MLHNITYKFLHILQNLFSSQFSFFLISFIFYFLFFLFLSFSSYTSLSLPLSCSLCLFGKYNLNITFRKLTYINFYLRYLIFISINTIVFVYIFHKKPFYSHYYIFIIVICGLGCLLIRMLILKLQSHWKRCFHLIFFDFTINLQIIVNK